MTEPAERHSLRGWSLRKRVVGASLAMLVLLAALFTLMVVSVVSFKGRGDEVIDRWQPAFTVSQDLLADLVNQETGVRGYALGKDRAFLQPYNEYLPQERVHEKALAGYLEGRTNLLEPLFVFRTAAESWRSSIARPFIARVARGDPTVGASAASRSAKAAFDTIRSTSASLTAAIRAVRDQAKSERVRAVNYVWIAVSASGALILGAGLLLWRGLRKSVLEPVEDLATQTRDVARGAIDKRIIEGGPPEIAGLGQDVDRMRARIASELARVERARANLEQRSAELARSNADLEQFAYVASHDLSEPLRKVANFCQLLERQYAAELDDKAKQYINFAVDGAKRMQTLIGDLLSFSRVGRTTEEFEQVSIDNVLSRALATLDDRVVAVDAEIVRGSLPVLPGDATLLTALFQNLVGNSLKYRSVERTPRVEISAEERGVDWLFTISDNGIGVDPQYGERIFTIFQRLHLRDSYGGTGIGLALCRKIVEFHHGKIWLGDHDGPGATFQFTIPQHADKRDTVDVDEY